MGVVAHPLVVDGRLDRNELWAEQLRLTQDRGFTEQVTLLSLNPPMGDETDDELLEAVRVAVFRHLDHPLFGTWRARMPDNGRPGSEAVFNSWRCLYM